jgi:uncharacterized protein YndB with AHSA1/START domain
MSVAREKIVIERTYPATAEEVWALWTTKEGFESWWGPEGFRVEVHAIEPRVGGSLRYDMIADSPQAIAAMKSMGEPTSHATHGTFTEIKPHERLAITHVIDFLRGVEPYESTVVADIHPTQGGVRMVITLRPMHDEHWTKMAVEGWKSQLTKLDKRYGLTPSA